MAIKVSKFLVKLAGILCCCWVVNMKNIYNMNVWCKSKVTVTVWVNHFLININHGKSQHCGFLSGSKPCVFMCSLPFVPVNTERPERVGCGNVCFHSSGSFLSIFKTPLFPLYRAARSLYCELKGVIWNIVMLQLTLQSYSEVMTY